MFCIKCGTKIEGNPERCPACGQILKNSSSSNETVKKKNYGKSIFIGLVVIIIIVTVVITAKMIPDLRIVSAMKRNDFDRALNLYNEYIDSDSWLVNMEINRQWDLLKNKAEIFTQSTDNIEEFKTAYDEYNNQLECLKEMGDKKVNKQIDKFIKENGFNNLSNDIQLYEQAENLNDASSLKEAISYYARISQNSPLQKAVSTKMDVVIEKYKEEYGKKIDEAVLSENIYDISDAMSDAINIDSYNTDYDFNSKYDIENYFIQRLVDGLNKVVDVKLKQEDKSDAEYLVNRLSSYLNEEQISYYDEKINGMQITEIPEEESTTTETATMENDTNNNASEQANNSNSTDRSNSSFKPSKLKPYTYSGDGFMGDVSMGGKAFKNAVVLRMWSAGEISSAFYNLNGKYFLFNGTYGFEDGTDTVGVATIKIYGDDKLIQQYSVSAAKLPQDFSIKVDGVNQLRIEAEQTNSSGAIGFGNLSFK